MLGDPAAKRESGGKYIGYVQGLGFSPRFTVFYCAHTNVHTHTLSHTPRVVVFRVYGVPPCRFQGVSLNKVSLD